MEDMRSYYVLLPSAYRMLYRDHGFRGSGMSRKARSLRASTVYAQRIGPANKGVGPRTG